MKRKLQQINPNVEINTADSGRYKEVKEQFIPRGTLSTVFGHWTNMIDIEINFANKKRR